MNNLKKLSYDTLLFFFETAILIEIIILMLKETVYKHLDELAFELCNFIEAQGEHLFGAVKMDIT
ncbi:MAG: hypothetical protein DRH90_16440 [Deltaproteobacteria bacterium]|nr:MAG: hypothetical protein DRH90_16440 [Deltaproteobacteria bacterium]RLC15552.1 MAG: hypothetical protein DRI24_10640 [Deltaproteobacteria bacterium]